MGVQNFIPELWAANVLVPFRKNLVAGSLVNRDYEGEIRNAGDTVKINEINAVTVNDYTRRGALTFQEIDSAQQELLVDQEKYFAVSMDDVDNAQTKPKLMQSITAEAGYAMADTVDQHITGLYGDAGAEITALTVTVGNVLLNLSNFGLELDQNNVPSNGRFVLIPPWYAQHIWRASSGAVSADGVPKLFDNGLFVNGYIGKIYGLNLLMTNNLSNNGTVWQMMGLTRAAITHAMQITKVKAGERDGYFDEYVKGLMVYGSKVVRPEALVLCAATQG